MSEARRFVILDSIVETKRKPIARTYSIARDYCNGLSGENGIDGQGTALPGATTLTAIFTDLGLFVSGALASTLFDEYLKTAAINANLAFHETPRVNEKFLHFLEAFTQAFSDPRLTHSTLQ